MRRLTWDDLLIQNLSASDCTEYLSHWDWLIAGTFAPEFLSKFGNWFLRRPEGHVEILDVFSGNISIIADSHAQFADLVNTPWWQELYLHSELVYQLHEGGKIPDAGQCYALAPHPAQGGPNPLAGDPIDPKFIMVMDIAVWQSLCSGFVRPKTG